MTSYIDPRGKLMGHLPRLAMLQEAKVPPPINVEIDLSFRCSLGCEWCRFAYTHVRGPLAGKAQRPAGAVLGGDLMDAELARRIIDELAAAGVDSISWVGGGEPTLHPNFDEIIAYADGKLEAGIYTHGGHIDEGRAALMKRVLTWVYVSLDAVNAEGYRTAKGVNRFAAACQGIRNLVAADGTATIGVGFLLGATNWRDVFHVGELLDDLGADYAQVRPIIRYQADAAGELAEDTAWVDEALPHIDALATAYSNVEFDRERFTMYRDWSGHGYATCWWSALQTVITPNGKMFTCTDKREHAAAEIGDLSDESFEDIWKRRPIASVDGSCRLSCRGHVPNQVLNDLMQPRRHEAFV